MLIDEKIGMQSLEDKTNWEYDNAYDNKVRMDYVESMVFDGVEPEVEKYGVPNNWIELAKFVEKDLKEANEKYEDDSRIEFHYNEEILKDFGYLFFNELSIYLYRDGYNEEIVSNYMFMNKEFGDEYSSFMIDLYCRRDEYFSFDIIGRVLQEMVNVWRDIPLYLEEKRNKKDNKTEEEK